MTKLKEINSFFRLADAAEVADLKQRIVLSERQQLIFEMYYIQKKNVNFIADTLYVCPMVINKELKNIRDKLIHIKFV